MAAGTVAWPLACRQHTKHEIRHNGTSKRLRAAEIQTLTITTRRFATRSRSRRRVLAAEVAAESPTSTNTLFCTTEAYPSTIRELSESKLHLTMETMCGWREGLRERLAILRKQSGDALISNLRIETAENWINSDTSPLFTATSTGKNGFWDGDRGGGQCKG